MLTRALFLVLIICTTLQTVLMQQVSKRIGCYIDDKDDRDLPNHTAVGYYGTIAYCLTYCKSNGFNYTGVQAASHCTCGNSFGRHGKANDSECQRKCLGDKSQSTTCGGDFRNEIYTTGKYHIARIGCFNGVENDQDLPQMHDAGSEATVPYCLNYCKSKGFNYTGVMASSMCYCGNSYRSHVIQEDLNCYFPCSGDSLTTCGGPTPSKEIFRTFYDEETSTTTTAETTATTTMLDTATTSTASTDDITTAKTSNSTNDTKAARTTASKTAISPAPLLVPLLIPVVVPLLVQLLVC